MFDFFTQLCENSGMQLNPAQKTLIFALLLGSACARSTPPAANTAPGTQTPNNNLIITPVDPNGHCSVNFVNDWNSIANNSKTLIIDLATHKLESIVVQADLESTHQACTTFYTNDSGISCLAEVRKTPKQVDSKIPAELCNQVGAAIQKYSLRSNNPSADLFSRFDAAPDGEAACDENFLLVFNSFQAALVKFQNAREMVLAEEALKQLNADDLATAMAQAKGLTDNCDLLMAGHSHFACAVSANDGTLKSVSVEKMRDYCYLARNFGLNKKVTAPTLANARLRRAATAFPRLHPITYLP